MGIEPVMSMMAKSTKKAPTICTKLIMWWMFYGLKYFCDGLCRAVECDGVASFFAFECHVDGSLCADGEVGLLRHWLCTAVRHQELACPDAEETPLLVGDDDGTVFGTVERGKGYQFLQYTNDNGVMTRPIWELMNRLPMFDNCETDGLKNTQIFADRVVNIPSSVRLITD